MRFLLRSDIDAFCTHMHESPVTMPATLREAIHPTEVPLQATYDFAGLLSRPVDALFDCLRETQPRAHAELSRRDPQLFVGERYSAHPMDPARRLWQAFAFLRVDDRFLIVRPFFRNGSPSVLDTRHVSHRRYASLPPEIAQAYYDHVDGIEVMHRLPGSAFDARGLPATLTGWRRGEAYAGGSKPRKEAMKSAFTAVADPAVESAPGAAWSTFGCMLDTREQDDAGTAGDQLFVQEGSAARRIFHVADSRFDALRIVADPVRLLDEYVAWVFAGGDGRFDFNPFSRPA